MSQKYRATVFLKSTVVFVGIATLAVCIFLLPWIANYAANLYPELAYLQYPALIGIYTTVIPFVIALREAFRLLGFIDKDNAFSEMSVQSLKRMRYCAVAVGILCAIGVIFAASLNNSHLGVVMLGLVGLFASIVIAVFLAVLQRLFEHALTIKTENNLTV